MSTFYLNVDSTGVDKLLMGPGIYWSYATDGTSYTLTPVFDTTLITLPSDVQVWYSNDGTNFAYSPAWITSRTGDTITVTVAFSTTVTAKLYYVSGTVVTDENGAEVASVSTVIGGGTAPTFDGTPSASATNPTVGDSVSVLTYAASGNPTPTVTFEWFVDAVSQAETTDTFDTTGLSGGETLTCTVTASNGVSPDATANVDFGTVAAAGDPWDTYGDGEFSETWDGATTVIVPTVAYQNTASAIQITQSGGQLRTRYWNLDGGDVAPPYIVQYNQTQATWSKFSYDSVGNPSTGTSTIQDYDVVSGALPTAGDVVYWIYQSQDPGDPTGWSAYV